MLYGVNALWRATAARGVHPSRAFACGCCGGLGVPPLGLTPELLRVVVTSMKHFQKEAPGYATIIEVVQAGFSVKQRLRDLLSTVGRKG